VYASNYLPGLYRLIDDFIVSDRECNYIYKKSYTHTLKSTNNAYFVIAETGILVKMAMCQESGVSGIRGLNSTPNTSDCKNGWFIMTSSSGCAVLQNLAYNRVRLDNLPATEYLGVSKMNVNRDIILHL